VEYPATSEVAPLSVDLTNLDNARKKRFTPPRVEWERRYRPLVDDSLRAVFALQEADRFRAFDSAARAFEMAFVSQQLAPGDARLTQAAAQAAAALGLLVPSSSGNDRVPLAESLLGNLPKSQELAQQLTVRNLRLL
jgi:hypothetical protein